MPSSHVRQGPGPWVAAGLAAGLVLAAGPGLHAAEEEHAMTPSHDDAAVGEGEQCPLPISEVEFKRRLSAEQYRVMREGGTERPFANAYWNNKHPGLYVDPVTGEALFASTDKFDSRTGWPSFTRPVDPDAVVEETDRSHGMVRTEVKATQSGSHLGHVFDDGPGPTGLRYCINSAALTFIPVEDLEQEGYGRYLALFAPSTPETDAAP